MLAMGRVFWRRGVSECDNLEKNEKWKSSNNDIKGSS